MRIFKEIMNIMLSIILISVCIPIFVLASITNLFIKSQEEEAKDSWKYYRYMKS